MTIIGMEQIAKSLANTSFTMRSEKLILQNLVSPLVGANSPGVSSTELAAHGLPECLGIELAYHRTHLNLRMP